MAEIPVSAFIITKNEEARIGRVIEALRGWIDDIVVVDSGSTDHTVEIAKKLGAQVHVNAWTGYGPQKCFGERLCRHDWVLNVDADEVVSPALAAEIQALFAGACRRGQTSAAAGAVPPEPGVYRIKIPTVYPGDEKPRPFANDYNVVRFYHRSVATYSDHPVFDRVVLKGVTPKQLRHPLYHYSHLSFAHVIEKSNTFSSFRTEHSKPRSTFSLKLRLAVEFPVCFVKYYFFRRHCMGGWKGFYMSLAYAFMRTTRIAKMLEAATAPDARAATSAERHAKDMRKI